MNTQDTTQPKQLHFALVLLISFALFNLGYIVDQTIRWSNHVEGYMNGVIHIIFLGFAWCIYLIPWSVIVFALYRCNKWRRFRTLWLLAPAVLAFLLLLIFLAVDPPTAKRTFKKMVMSPVPDSVTNLKAFRSGGGIADYTYLIYFEIDPEEFDKILKSKPYGQSDYKKNISYIEYCVKSIPPGWPSSEGWTDTESYIYSTNGWTFYFITDKEHRRVYFSANCI
jgi:hypothetical protein